MQIDLQMVGHHRTNTVNIKGVQFTNGKATVYGIDEHVVNLCRYLEDFGAFQPHVAEQKQAVLDGEGDMLGIRAARKMKAKAEEMMAEANAKMLKAQEVVEERLQADAQAEREGAAAATLVAKERTEAAKANQEALDGTVEDQPSTEGRGSEQAPSQRSSKSSKHNKR